MIIRSPLLSVSSLSEIALHIFLGCMFSFVFQGHEDRFSIYVHASRERPKHVSPLFIDRDIHSKKVFDRVCFPSFQLISV